MIIFQDPLSVDDLLQLTVYRVPSENFLRYFTKFGDRCLKVIYLWRIGYLVLKRFFYLGFYALS